MIDINAKFKHVVQDQIILHFKHLQLFAPLCWTELLFISYLLLLYKLVKKMPCPVLYPPPFFPQIFTLPKAKSYARHRTIQIQNPAIKLENIILGQDCAG